MPHNPHKNLWVSDRLSITLRCLVRKKERKIERLKKQCVFIRLVAALRFKWSFKQSRGGEAGEVLSGKAEERIARNGGKEKSKED